MCGISGQKNWEFQLCISQTSQADRTTGDDGILGGITIGYATTSNHPQGRLSNNHTSSSKAKIFIYDSQGREQELVNLKNKLANKCLIQKCFLANNYIVHFNP